jgi:hypothetical protein
MMGTCDGVDTITQDPAAFTPKVKKVHFCDGKRTCALRFR